MYLRKITFDADGDSGSDASLSSYPDLNFNYDREAFVTAKNQVLLASLDMDTANTNIQGTSKFKSSGVGNTEFGTAFTGAPTTTYTSVTCSELDDIKEKFQSAYDYIHEFNSKMDGWVSTISSIDPDLESAIKEMEKAVADAYVDYMNETGASASMMGATDLYELVKKYSDELNLTTEEAELVDELASTYEYFRMNGWEKFWTNAAVFALSTVEGLLQVGEYIVDGAITLGGGLAGLACYAFDSDTANAIWDGTASVVDYNVSEEIYDAYVEAYGLNAYAAYGTAHTAGYAVGYFAGETLLTMIPGGAAAAATVQGLKAVGKSMASTADNENLSSGERILTASETGAVAAAATYGTKAITANYTANVESGFYDPRGYSTAANQVVLQNAGIRLGKNIANDYINYTANGSQGSFGTYLANDAGSIASDVMSGVIGDASSLNEASGYLGTATGSHVSTVNRGYTYYDRTDTAFDAANSLDDYEYQYDGLN